MDGKGVERKVRLTLVSRQIMDGKTQELVQRPEGTVRTEGEKVILSWRETPDSGLGETYSQLTLYPAGAVLVRTGEVRAKMVFQEGKTWAFRYETPCGGMDMALRTGRVTHLEPAGAELEYCLLPGGGEEIPTRLRLETGK